MFQSTLPVRGATRDFIRHGAWFCVSIHAPVRGATRYADAMEPTDSRFNPRPRTGATRPRYLPPPSGRCQMFQSTPPCGGDDGQLLMVGCGIVSIHAPVRGATPDHATRTNHLAFQSTPPYGGRLRTHLSAGSASRLFQSTPPYGGRLRAHLSKCASNCFNPRPRTGGDIGKSAEIGMVIVSIHAPVRGATPSIVG